MPEWYIDRCMKIKYMFPKAHAAAYMIAALRLGWYKVHRPVEYYAAYFTVRGEDFDGVTAVRRSGRCPPHERNQMKREGSDRQGRGPFATLQIINEMLARGIQLLPVDFYKSDAKQFLVEDGKIRLPFLVFGGVGEAAANSLAAGPRVAGSLFPWMNLQSAQQGVQSGD